MSFAIHACIRTTLLLMCVGLLSSLMTRASASFRHAVWSAALAGALLLPVTSIVLGVKTLEILPEKPAQPVVRPAAVSAPEVGASSSDPRLTEPSAADIPAWNWTRWITLFWAAGACIALLPLLAAFRHLKRLKAASQPLDGSWAALVHDSRQNLSISTQVDIGIGANPGPLTFGVLRKTILLPSGEKSGAESSEGLFVKRMGWPPATCCTQMSRLSSPLRSEA